MDQQQSCLQNYGGVIAVAIVIVNATLQPSNRSSIASPQGACCLNHTCDMRH